MPTANGVPNASSLMMPRQMGGAQGFNGNPASAIGMTNQVANPLALFNGLQMPVNQYTGQNAVGLEDAVAGAQMWATPPTGTMTVPQIQTTRFEYHVGEFVNFWEKYGHQGIFKVYRNRRTYTDDVWYEIPIVHNKCVEIAPEGAPYTMTTTSSQRIHATMTRCQTAEQSFLEPLFFEMGKKQMAAKLAESLNAFRRYADQIFIEEVRRWNPFSVL